MKQQNQQRQKEQVHTNPSGLGMSAIDPRYRDLTCYNCGEPDHFVGICTKPKVCFICAIPGYYMIDCQFWKQSPPVATYLGSARLGLGFYHIDLPEVDTKRWLNLTNCCVVKVKRREVTLSELEKELSDIFL
jgi:hypothetical protein